MVQWEMMKFKLNTMGAGKEAIGESLLQWEGFECTSKDKQGFDGSGKVGVDPRH